MAVDGCEMCDAGCERVPSGGEKATRVKIDSTTTN